MYYQAAFNDYFSLNKLNRKKIFTSMYIGTSSTDYCGILDDARIS